VFRVAAVKAATSYVIVCSDEIGTSDSISAENVAGLAEQIVARRRGRGPR
jgi:hypothetical protein